MSGYKNLNYEKFNEMSRILSRLGHEVYNPATTFNGAILDLPYDVWLREAVRLVSMVNGIVLLEGWEKSRGALTELHIALSLGMPVYVYYVGLQDISQVEIGYPTLVRCMNRMYTEDFLATANGLSQSSSGYPRQAEGREDYPNGNPVGHPLQGLVDTAVIR